jgi:hypothetical protein
MEGTYWLADRGFFGFATAHAREKPPEAEPGPNRERRQARMDELKDGRFVDEDTALPAVAALVADARRGARAVGARPPRRRVARDGLGHPPALEREPALRPASYHYGSVWPLFTGWVSMAAYRYGRPHVGYQALMANALLTERERSDT